MARCGVVSRVLTVAKVDLAAIHSFKTVSFTATCPVIAPTQQFHSSAYLLVYTTHFTAHREHIH